MKSYFNINNKPFLVLTCCYLVVMLGEICGALFESTTTEIIFKPILGLSLIIYYVHESKKINFLYVATLITVILSDLTNIFNHEDYWLYISSTFTTAYFVMYAVLFTRRRKIPFKKVFSIFLLFLSCVGAVFFVIVPNIQEIFLIGLINSLTLLYLCSVAFSNLLAKNNNQNLMYFICFFLLIIANAIFGIYKYHKEFVTLDLLVILIYSIVHYLICNIMVFEQDGTINVKS